MDEAPREPMPREIDERKKRKALSRIRRARAAAERAIEASEDEEAAAAARQMLSDWEEDFVASVEQRLNEYGSAFADPEKGNLDEPLSRLQELKLKEIEKKARGVDVKNKRQKRRFGLSSKPKPSQARVRDINEDVAPPAPQEPPGPRPAQKADPMAPTIEINGPLPKGVDPETIRRRFQVIEGGKDG